MNSPILTPRLRAAAELVRTGATVADIGTDHAYLPITLVLEGKARRAVASDINKGPYLRALANIKEHLLSDKIDALCTDGLRGIEEYTPSDIVICGMGGELIASIINDAPWTKNKDIRLILQPMTHPELLRKYLSENGYSIIEEKLAKEEKIYQIICAEFTGENTKYSETELIFGKLNIERGTDIFYELVTNHIEILKRIVLAKKSSLENANAEKEKNLIDLMEALKNDRK